MEQVGRILKESTFEIAIQSNWKKRGYSAISNSIVHNKNLSLQAKGLYWYLYTMLFQKDSCYASYEHIAKDLGLNRKTAYKYLKELKDQKLVQSVRRGQGKANKYILRF